ncbi:uncharacterized protein BT62DRAFT_465491 [Guyanagaster necrorhizus]|uniref:Uncharacterized protein n=1 Tax=Guyanagaster necrorhizus TaxID=856835 RepID=A0A9P7VK55_9AGAR|nr:uncharacterized protein BT62DRAFT_465491 [Guyanagaster necrorhizus MCA 3950]KAG7441825.1 hypothetical protein BT62DRAFT_465491 [Guyanagaster necrorhizus MCA 3950]
MTSTGSGARSISERERGGGRLETENRPTPQVSSHDCQKCWSSGGIIACLSFLCTVHRSINVDFELLREAYRPDGPLSCHTICSRLTCLMEMR